MKLEIIVQNKEEAIMAEKLGADRLELVSAMLEDGLTPSYGTIKQVLHSVNIPVQVMIRPHSYYYTYKDVDLEIICEDVKKVLELGGDKIVFGALTEDNKIDERVLQKVIDLDPNLDITFHRAFDDIASLEEAYLTLSKYKNNIKRILTSAGEVGCVEGKYKLKELVELSKKYNGPEIMPGAADLGPETIEEVHQTVGAKLYHVGPTVRFGLSYANEFNPESIKKVKDVISN